jgi:hypothetical protein
MTTWLRLLAIALLAGGLGTAGWAGTRALGDTAFAEAAKALARHPEHVMFQAEYYVAAARYYGLVATAVASGVGGVVFASILLALASLLQRESSGS